VSADPGSGVALVTGASGGIGADIARVLAQRGETLALVARSRDKLEELAGEIAATGAPRPHVFCVDLSDRDGPEQLQRDLADRALRVSILVNNAGFGLAGQASALARVEQLNMIDLNIRALVDLTLRFVPDLAAAHGRLMNVASVASFIPGPGMAVYYATKAFVLSFSEAMSAELKTAGVTVTALCPGLTPTGFQDRAGMSEGLSRLAPTMSSRSVAEAGVAALFAGRRVAIPGWSNKVFTKIGPLLPRAVLLPVLLSAQGKRRQPAASK
jgi:uncharacterized protein